MRRRGLDLYSHLSSSQGMKLGSNSPKTEFMSGSIKEPLDPGTFDPDRGGYRLTVGGVMSTFTVEGRRGQPVAGTESGPRGRRCGKYPSPFPVVPLTPSFVTSLPSRCYPTLRPLSTG